MSINDDILNKLIGHQIGLHRLASGNVNTLVKKLNKGDADILRLIRDLEDDFTIGEVESLIREVKRENNRIYDGLFAATLGVLAGVAIYEAEYQAALIAGVTGVVLDIPEGEELVTQTKKTSIAGSRLKELFDGLTDHRFKRMRETIRMSYQRGEDVARNVVNRVRGTKALGYRDGLFQTSRRSLDQVIRTAQNGIAHSARELFFHSNKHLFDSVLWVSVLDERTTAVCMDLSGQLFGLNEGPRPPMHFNCRSMVVPVLRGELPPDIPRYDEWLREQTNSLQNEILGPTRAELFRKGMDLHRFVDETGHKYTLEELAKREGIRI